MLIYPFKHSTAIILGKKEKNKQLYPYCHFVTGSHFKGDL